MSIDDTGIYCGSVVDRALERVGGKAIINVLDGEKMVKRPCQKDGLLWV